MNCLRYRRNLSGRGCRLRSCKRQGAQPVPLRLSWLKTLSPYNGPAASRLHPAELAVADQLLCNGRVVLLQERQQFMADPVAQVGLITVTAVLPEGQLAGGQVPAVPGG
jgi:hypothetical protein